MRNAASPSEKLFGIFTPGRLWVGIFAFWLLFLSGLIGGPGVIQLLRLQNLLTTKQQQGEALREGIKKLENDLALLDKSKLVQQREIRRVLGYSAPDELIFDFTSAEDASR